MDIVRWVVIFGIILNINYGGCKERRFPDEDMRDLLEPFELIQMPPELPEAVEISRPKRPKNVDPNYISFSRPHPLEFTVEKSQKREKSGPGRSLGGEEPSNPDSDSTYMEALVLRPSAGLQEKDYGLVSRTAPSLSIRPTISIRPTLTLLHLLSGSKYSPTLLLKPTYAMKPTLTISPKSDFKQEISFSAQTAIKPVFQATDEMQPVFNYKPIISDHIPQGEDSDTTFSDLIIDALQVIKNNTLPKAYNGAAPANITVTYNNAQSQIGEFKNPIKPILPQNLQENTTKLNQHKERLLLSSKMPISFTNQQNYVHEKQIPVSEYKNIHTNVQTNKKRPYFRPLFKAQSDTTIEPSLNKTELKLPQETSTQQTSYVAEMTSSPVKKKKRPMLSLKPGAAHPRAVQKGHHNVQKNSLLSVHQTNLSSKIPPKNKMSYPKTPYPVQQEYKAEIIEKEVIRNDTNIDDSDIGLEMLMQDDIRSTHQNQNQSNNEKEYKPINYVLESLLTDNFSKKPEHLNTTKLNSTKLVGNAEFRVTKDSSDFIGNLSLDSLLDSDSTLSPIDEFQNELHKSMFGEDASDEKTKHNEKNNTNASYVNKFGNPSADLQPNSFESRTRIYNSKIENVTANLNNFKPTNESKVTNIRNKLILPTKYRNHITFSDNPKLVDHTKLNNDTKLIVPTRFQNRISFSDAPPTNSSRIVVGKTLDKLNTVKPKLNYESTTREGSRFIDFTRSSNKQNAFDSRYIGQILENLLDKQID